jgi:pyruvate,water dikinase
MAAHGHRGHADRDIYYARRCEDPDLDYETFRALLSAKESVDPRHREREVADRRNSRVANIEARLRSQRAGRLRVAAFRALLRYVQRFFLYRDNQRHYFDRYTFSLKRGAVEFGRRLKARGVLARAEDVYFLSRSEVYALLRGAPATPLTALKIEGRRRNFLRVAQKSIRPPKYLRGNNPVSPGAGTDDGGMTGAGTSRGRVTGRARIILSLKDIGKVEEGDILVTYSTDPGWTPVFALLHGIVLETGGMLAHGSLLAREYGFPPVQLEEATSRIPDGATITVDGDTGTIVIEQTPATV